MEVEVPLAGRRRELTLVSDVLTGTSITRAMLISAEAGIGKTQLAAAAMVSAADADVTVLRGWCLPMSEGLPFLPIIDVLRELAGVDEGRVLKSVLSECPPFVRGEAARLLPELSEPGEPVPAAEPEDGWRRQRLFDALRRLFAELARTRQAAVLLEDIHWSDRTTMEFLDYLLTPARAPGISFVITCRTGGQPSPELTAWLDRLQHNHNVTRLYLGALNRTETADQIQSLLGRPADPALIEDTYRRSEGNPFFTEQLITHSRTNPDRGLPPALTALLLSRTASSSTPARDVLTCLAVARRPLDETSLTDLLGRPTEQIRDSLRELLTAQLARRVDANGYQPSHALLAEAIEDSLLSGQRRELHGQIAELLETTAAPAAAVVAMHWAAAGLTDHELRWRVAAARHAEAVFAPAEAFDHWRRVIELQIANPEANDPVELAEAYTAALSAAESSGNWSAQTDLAEQAMARLGPLTGLPAVRLYRWIGVCRSFDSAEAGLAVLHRAITIGRGLPPSEDYVRALREYAAIRDSVGDAVEAREVSRVALEAARAIGSLNTQKLVQVQNARLNASLGADITATNADMDAALAIESDDPAVNVEATIGYTDLALKQGDLQRVLKAGVPAIEQAMRDGQSDAFRLRLLRMNICEAHLELGDVAAAAQSLGSPPEGSPTADWLMTEAAARAAVDVCQGRLGSAMSYWNTHSELLHRTSSLGWRRELTTGWVEACLWVGDPATAVAQSRQTLGALHATDDARFSGPLFVLAARALADLAEQITPAGDTAAFSALRRDTEEVERFLAAARFDPFADWTVPVTARACGLSWQAERTRLHAAIDHVATDPTYWERAAQAWAELTRPHRAGYARWRHAEALLAQPNNRAAATASLRAAAAQGAGHAPLTAVISDLARRARIDVDQANAADLSSKSSKSPVFGLTQRERQVLRLLGAGKTNTEIGAALFISSRTASVHVTNILRKLDVATRVQAAAVAERAGLLNDRAV